MKKKLVIFCMATLVAVVGLAALLFSYAAVPVQTLVRSHTPQPMQSMADINLPNPYGTVSVTDLVGYYIEHPPTARSVSAGDDGGGHHFGGC